MRTALGLGRAKTHAVVARGMYREFSPSAVGCGSRPSRSKWARCAAVERSAGTTILRPIAYELARWLAIPRRPCTVEWRPGPVARVGARVWR
jgi:hypothetical protein